jgi:phospholipid-translocating ATPase
MSAEAKSAHQVSAEKPDLLPAPSQKSRLATKLCHWYRIYFVELILRQEQLPPSKDGRHIPLDLYREDVLIDERRGRPYVSNAIRTSRYTLYDFLPKQIIFQFSRLANFYLLCVGIPQMIPGLSTTGNYTTIIPLLFFVALMVAKEGFDDWKRHRLDKVENARKVKVLRKAPASGYHWAEVQWRNITVGDVIRLTRDEDVPADMVLLHADGDSGFAYVETMALDGETNLKSKQVSAALEGCSTVQGILDCRVDFVVEDPNPNLYHFNGRVTTGSQTLPLTLSEVVYRGSTLRNTPEAIGIVVNTGEECKIRKNANQHPEAKKPALEKIANKIVISLAIYVIILTVGCSMGYLLWQKSTEQHSWYLADAQVRFVEIFMGFLIQFNNVIPLALYVSLEIVKLGQMVTLNWDIEMYDEASDTPARCNTNTILENLGQIGYVFSDKTGTLTENVMKFRKMSIAGTSWLHGSDMAKDQRAEMAAAGQESRHSSDEHDNPRITLSDPVVTEPTTRELIQFARSNPASEFSKRATEYILAMALCHTCLPEIRDGKINFQAASPDELALVQAANDLGYLLVERSSRFITLEVNNGDGPKTRQVFEILDVIEFSSKRKRMSIIVRCPDGRIWLVCKGADSTILPRLRLAHLAMQQANEVRKSVELERQLGRTSEAHEPRNSFGGRPSLVLRRSSAFSRVASTSVDLSRSKSLEVRNSRKSSDRLRPEIAVRAVSFAGSSMIGRGANLHGTRGAEHRSLLQEIPCDDDSAIFSQCFRQLDEFANEGLRTLLFAHRYLSEEEYALWKKVYNDATTSLVDRQERIEAAAELIEQYLELTGASAIEDKLQKGVPETIDRLRRANIKVWMLTGDKRETAINIAHSARICLPSSLLFIVDATKGDLEGQFREMMDALQHDAMRHSVMVVDGSTLAAIEEPSASELQRLFYTLIPTVDSVICCRASPAQKARLVRAIRDTLSASSSRRMSIFHSLFDAPNPLTLAIGDGANDLAMLAEAHVGIGISGKEGMQAARVADYSIAQFRFLSRLLLVHGRWNYVRTARFILATFWKEMFFYLPTALYQRYNGYTGTSLYESWSLTVLNVLFTSLAVIAVGICEQDLGADTLLAVPELYVFGQRNRGLNMAKYGRWMVCAVAEGVFVWFACWAGYGYLFDPGRDEGLFALGDLVFTVAVMWINLKLL